MQEDPKSQPDRLRFLTLARAKVTKSASAAEIAELKHILERFPELKDDMGLLGLEYETEQEERIMEIALRTICGTATALDMETVSVWQQNNTRRWTDYREAVALLNAIASPVKPHDLPPMSSDTRTKVFAEIAKLKKQ